MSSFYRKYKLVLALLGLIAFVAYGWSIAIPSLFGDEWAHLGAHVDRGAACPIWSQDRPFDSCWFAVIYTLFGLNVSLHHLASVMLSWLCAVLMLAVLDRLLPSQQWLNAACAGLFLVYPTVLARNWPAGQISFAIALLLAAVLLGLLFWRRGRWLLWLGGSLLFWFALGAYEAVAGVTCLLSVTAFFLATGWKPGRRMLLLTPFVLAVLTALRLLTSNVTRYGTDAMTTDLLTVAKRLLFGIRVDLQWGWTGAVRNLVTGFPDSWRGINEALALALAGILLLFMVAARTFLSLRRTRMPAVAAEGEDRRSGFIRPGTLLRIGVAGLALTVAGYFPFVLAFSPGSDFEGSRSHYLPSLGASMVVCAVVFGTAQLLSARRSDRVGVAMAAIIPLLLLGVANHILLNEQVRDAWEDQTRIWEQLFAVAPDIGEGGHVVILLDGYEQTWGPYPFISGPVGMRSALNLLYGRDSLSGMFGYGRPERVLSYSDGKIVVDDSFHDPFAFPASETVVVAYSRPAAKLTRIIEIRSGDDVFSLGDRAVLSEPPPAGRAQYRWLVR